MIKLLQCDVARYEFRELANVTELYPGKLRPPGDSSGICHSIKTPFIIQHFNLAHCPHPYPFFDLRARNNNK